MKIMCIIANEKQQWKEEFTVENLETAENEIKAVVDYYNDTLNAGDLPRKFIKLLG